MYRNEIWKPINGYEEFYEISNLGRVRKNKNGKYILRKISFNHTTGYYYIPLSKDGVVKNYYIHRLVAEHFIPNIDNKPTVNHINADTSNNCEWNLEWATMMEQNNHKKELNSIGTHKGVINMNEDKPKRILINLVADEETREKYNRLKKESGYTPLGFIKHLLDLYEKSQNNQNN